MIIDFKDNWIMDKQTRFARAGPEPPPPKHRWWTDGSSQGPP